MTEKEIRENMTLQELLRRQGKSANMERLHDVLGSKDIDEEAFAALLFTKLVWMCLRGVCFGKD